MGFCTLKCLGLLPAALLLAGCGNTVQSETSSMRHMSLYGLSTNTQEQATSQGGLHQVSFVSDGGLHRSVP